MTPNQSEKPYTPSDDPTRGGCWGCLSYWHGIPCPPGERVSMAESEPRPWCFVGGDEIEKARKVKP